MASPGESREGSVPSWLAWACGLQAPAQTGLTFTTGHYGILNKGLAGTTAQPILSSYTKRGNICD